jgi:hypothetical protein
MHPGRLGCENPEYADIRAFSRISGRAYQRPKLRPYFFMRSGSATDASPNPVLPELYLILEQANRNKQRFAYRRARVTLSPPF